MLDQHHFQLSIVNKQNPFLIVLSIYFIIKKY